VTAVRDSAPAPVPADVPTVGDHRGSWVPSPAMVGTRFMELRRRRGLMITLMLVTIGLPGGFLAVRLVLHAVAPSTYGPAGGEDVYAALTAGVMYVFGFVVAATLGCTAGSVDLTDGMFRHLVITGRSRIALYLARIPAGLAIILGMVAVGFAIVCTVCVVAAPTQLNYQGISVPAGLSKPALEQWAAQHADEVVCNFPYNGPLAVNVSCGNGPGSVTSGPVGVVGAGGAGPNGQTAAQAAVLIASQAYPDYASQFLYPSTSLMIKTGLWLELEATIGFIVGLGLGSLLGQRTVAVVLMIVLEIILTPILVRAQIPHMENLQRGVVGVATAQLEPGQLPLALGGGGRDFRITESTTTAVLVILGWLVVWTVVGAWRMATRDA
jgi:hypothetical protein